MADYKPNSHKYKESLESEKTEIKEKKIEQVTQGKTKKRSELTKVRDVFISEDAAKVKTYVLMDVLVPALKKAISDIIIDGVNMIFYGSTGAGKRRSPGDSVSYRSYYPDPAKDRFGDSRSVRTIYDYNDVILDTRGEAEIVLNSMQEIIDHYDSVSIADLYELCNIPGRYTDVNYGWTSLRGAEPIRVRDGYMLKLPRAISIKH